MSEQSMGSGDVAIEMGRRAVEAAPGVAELRINLGNAYGEAGRAGEALACFDEAIRLDPGEFMGHGSRAMLLDELGQADAAIESYQRAIAMQPDSLEAINNLWILFRETGRVDEALGLAERARGVWPDNVRVLMMMGSTLAALHRHEEAEPFLERASALAGPEDRQAVLRAFGLARYAENRAEEAIAYFDEAVRVTPNDAQLRMHRALALI